MQKGFKFCLIPAMLFYSHNLFSQIINIDKTDTSAYQKKAVLSGNVALAVEIDK